MCENMTINKKCLETNAEPKISIFRLFIFRSRVERSSSPHVAIIWCSLTCNVLVCGKHCANEETIQCQYENCIQIEKERRGEQRSRAPVWGPRPVERKEERRLSPTSACACMNANDGVFLSLSGKRSGSYRPRSPNKKRTAILS